MEGCGTLVAVCCEKVSWFECRSWAWPLNPQARRAWKCCSQYCLSEGNLYRKIQTRSYTDGSWREREKEVQSPLAGRMSQANTRFYWEWVKGKGCSQRTGRDFFFFFFQDEEKKPNHNSCLTPQNTLSEICKWSQIPGWSREALGVGFREILHTIFVESNHNDTHCNTLFALISWTFLFLRGAGCFCGCRLHTWTGLRWFI